MVHTSQLWKPLKILKKKSRHQLFLPLLPWSKDVHSSMDHHKTPSCQEWKRSIQVFTLETILKQVKLSLRLHSWISWPVLVSSQSQLFRTTTWVTMMEKICHLKDNLSQNKHRNPNVSAIFCKIQNFSKRKAKCNQSIQITQSSSSMFLHQVTVRRPLMNTSVKSSWVVNTFLQVTTFAKTLFWQQVSSLTWLSWQNWWQESPTKDKVRKKSLSKEYWAS